MLRTADLLKFAETGISVATLNRVREDVRQKEHAQNEK
jgi:hypothetical protein